MYVCMYVREMEWKKERERNCSISGRLSTFERFVTGERIMTAVKWGCVNMPAVEEDDVG